MSLFLKNILYNIYILYLLSHFPILQVTRHTIVTTCEGFVISYVIDLCVSVLSEKWENGKVKKKIRLV